MRFRPAGGLDLATGALILGGACLVALSIVAAVVLLSPQTPTEQLSPTSTSTPAARGAAAVPSDRVGAVVSVESVAGAGGAARPGDHVDVLGYFSRQITGAQAVTRVLVRDALVLSVDRGSSSVALTLALPQESALLLHEAQALGAHAYVTLRAVEPPADGPSSFSDADLANRLTGRGR